MTSVTAFAAARLSPIFYPQAARRSYNPVTGRQRAVSVDATRIRSFAPQLLVDDLERAVKFYSDVLGFSFGPPWRGFYAVGERDGFAVHLKCAPKIAADRAHRRQHQHLDVYADVVGVEELYTACKVKGVAIVKPLDRTAWGTKDFYLEDPDGYIIAFGEAEHSTAS